MKMFNTEQAAQYLFGSDGKPNTLHQWRYRKQGPKFVKVGKLVRYTQSDLDEFLSQRRHAGTTLSGAQTY